MLTFFQSHQRVVSGFSWALSVLSTLFLFSGLVWFGMYFVDTPEGRLFLSGLSRPIGDYAFTALVLWVVLGVADKSIRLFIPKG